MLEARAFEPEFLRKLDRLVLGIKRARTVRAGQRALGRVQGLGIEPENFKEYAPGDDLRFLDWNAFARLDELMLRTYRADRQVEVTALVDASASMGLPERDDKLGLALAIGASLAYIGMADNDAVRIGAFAMHRGSMKLEATPFHRRRESYLNFKPFVTSVKAGGETRLGAAVDQLLLQRRPAGTVVVISDFLVNESDVEDALKRLVAARHDVKVIHVMGEQESTAVVSAGAVSHSRRRDRRSSRDRARSVGGRRDPAQGRKDRRAHPRDLHRARDHLCAGVRRGQPGKLYGARTPAARNREIAVGLLNPQNFIYGLSLALLVLIYLRSRSRPTIEVSSLMLFDEAPAPVASVRHVRLDPLFWLEMATLAALTLAIAGLYVMRPPAPGHGRIHALVFDLGAGMSAREGSSTRLDQARRDAMEIINQAPAGDEFSVIAYALEAQARHPQTANLADLRKALDDLVPMAVPARTAALRAALIRARGASEIDLFADRPPAPAILGRRRLDGAGKFPPGRLRRLQSGDRVARSRHPGLDARPRRDSQFLRAASSRELAIDLGRQRGVSSDHDARAA